MPRGRKSVKSLSKSLVSKKCNKPDHQRYNGVCKPSMCYKGKATERPRSKSGKCPKRARGFEDFEPELYSYAGRRMTNSYSYSPKRNLNYIRPGHGYDMGAGEDEFESNY